MVGALRAAAHPALLPHHPFRAQCLGIAERRRIRISDTLRQAIMVAQVDEQHATMVANAVTPAGQANRLADVALAERAAGMGPVTMHGCLKPGVGMRFGAKRVDPKRGRVYPTQRDAATEVRPVLGSKNRLGAPILVA